MTTKRWYPLWEPRVPKIFEPQKSLPDCVRDNAIAAPDRIALSFYGYDITYKELDEAASRFASGLADSGVKKGDRVALFMQNCPQFVISYLGTLRAGVCVVTLNPMFKYAELEYELNDSRAETLVALDYLLPEVKRAGDRIKLKNIIVTSLRDYLPQKPTLPIPPEMEQPKVSFPEAQDFLELLRKSSTQFASQITNLKEDMALLQYTGGTTGLPKGAILSHYSLAHAAGASALWFGYTRDDVHIGVTPFFHVTGMIQCMCSPLVSGGQVVILARFLPESVAESIMEYKGTSWTTTTTAVIAIVDYPDIGRYNLSSLRICWYGGAPMPTAVTERLKRMVPKSILGEGYGLSESLSQGGVTTPLSHHKPGFIGIPGISVDIKIVDLETGSKEVNPGEEGEILIKGPTIMRGYWNKPEATKEALKEGWLYTGDIGKMDEEGYVAILGRKKELIKCSGYSVFPSEVEELLHRHPAVAEVAVIGIPDAYRGETPKAFIILKPDYKDKIKEEKIIEWTKDNMASYKRPRIIEFRDALPKSAAGKILKRAVVEEEKERVRSNKQTVT
jgi:acyl-CoA synthetase (AMP-forming)/AMP-acid ligase II